MNIEIRDGSEIPSEFGPMKKAVKRTTVKIREPNGEEKFSLSWGELTAVPGVDVVICTETEQYPCKIDIFNATYREVSPGLYQKMAITNLVQIPKGVTVLLHTLEGEETATHPDYVAVGKKNEVYANKESWVQENLDFVE
jgi:hypothetical protein